MTKPLKYTGHLWCGIYNIKIVDHDGWRRDDGVTMDTPITFQDFIDRVDQCTVDLRGYRKASLEQETNQAATVAE